MRRMLIAALCCATLEAHADTLVIDWPGAFWSGVGSELLIANHHIHFAVDSYAIEYTDMIRRSGFDAVPWSWELRFDGGLGEGEGACLLEAGPPDARLRCDG